MILQQRLRYWTEAKAEFQRVKDEYDRKIDTLRDRLQEKQNESAGRHEGMIHYFWSVCGSFSVGGFAFPVKVTRMSSIPGVDVGGFMRRINIKDCKILITIREFHDHRV